MEKFFDYKRIINKVFISILSFLLWYLSIIKNYSKLYSFLLATPPHYFFSLSLMRLLASIVEFE